MSVIAKKVTMNDLIVKLIQLHAAPVLSEAVLDGRIVVLECAMPLCSCSNGRGYFDKKGSKNGKGTGNCLLRGYQS